MTQHLPGWRQKLKAPQWLVIYTRARNEKQVDKLLRQRGIQSYLPLHKVLKQWSDRKKWVYEPLFRSYLFVRITNVEYMQVVQIPGVVRFIYHDGAPAIVPDRQIEYVQQLISNEIPMELLPSDVKQGDRVRVTAGPLRECEGRLAYFQGQKRVMIRIDGIEQAIGATIPLSDIEKIREM